ncbi:heparinase II/III family protein [Paenarthrobacter sp. OM7]|uniref:heparinase II/III domain-containing protein n=1 Tax=Paenarthrobacter sp. OM7 TaxID=3041264 RepID=UPI00246943D1|nr:heparinase II/III family protein [Paenarthrobacter sp. OM7]WGM20263.1 heparinase II/III family protein [Paenarthrobacter sp. OM7]
MADAARFATLKTQDDDVSRAIKALIFQIAEKVLIASPVEYESVPILLYPVREVQGRVLALAMAYRLSDDARYLARARDELRRLSALKNWGTGHFLSVGEAAVAAGIGLDWLYDEIPEEERDHIASAIRTNALEPSLDAVEGTNGWVDGDYNWNQVCNAGLSVGALAVAERDPDLAARIVNRAIRNVPIAGKVYAPDGSYPEGVSYWAYGTSFHVILIEALRSVTGDSRGLEQLPGFLETADFKLHMSGPTGLDFTYADYHLENQNEPIMLWFASELGRLDLAVDELAVIQRLSRSSEDEIALRPNRLLPCELLWWKPELTGPGKTRSHYWTAGGVLPVAVMRSSWTDPRATFVAVKGGSPDHSHAHMDVGSFVLDADGVRWAVDPGTESYDRMRAAGITLWDYSQGSTRWDTFREGPEGHNILRFNGAAQDVAGKGEIAEMATQSGAPANVVDLTSLYTGQVARVERTVLLDTDNSVLISDEWTTGPQPVQAAWQWLTEAEVSVTPQGLLLRQDGESLALTVEPLANTTVAVEDVSGARELQDSSNPGLSRIVIRLSTPAGTTAKLRVRAIPGSAEHRTNQGFALPRHQQ